MSTKAVAADAASIEIFRGLSPEALEECAALAVRRTLPARQLVFSQGERCLRFQALLSGWLRITQAGRDGEQALIRFVGPGEIFGAFAMFADRFYPADAVTLCDAVELSWSEIHIRQLVERYPALAVNIVSLAARRLAELQDRLREVTTQPAEQRIANALLRLSRKSAHPLSGGSTEIAWPLTRRDIASIAGTTLHTASRILARWERAGIVATARRRVSIRSAPELARIGEGAA